MTYKNKKIKFIKSILDKLQWTGKREWYSAQDQESLCIQINKNSKSYYAQWATIKIVDGRRKTAGHRKYLAPYFWSIADVKTKLRKNIDAWKKASKANVDSLNVGALVREFKKSGLYGQRVKTRGKRLHYKAKTAKGYKEILDRYILLETIIDPVELKAKMADPIKFQGKFHDGALKDVPLDQIKRKDIEIWMERLSDTPAAANNALAALSIAFEFDLKKARDAMLPVGAINPCIRISKYEIAKDKKYIDIEKVIKMMTYLKKNKSFERKNIKIFLEELSDVETDNPTIIAFGSDAYSVLVRNLKEQYNILKVPHYSDYTNKEKYREQVRSILKY
jgi:hypothetical protein